MLTNEQVESLFRFCKKHYIHFYEVQSELVDHFAHAIEEQMAADPAIDFTTALNRTYLAFGEWKGMQKVQQEKVKAIRRQHAAQKRRIFFSYFRWPRLVYTVLLVLCAWLLANAVPPGVAQVMVPIAILGTMAWEMRYIWAFQHRMYLKKTQLLLFENYLSFGFFLLVILLTNKLVDYVVLSFTEPLGTVNYNQPGFYLLLPLFIIGINSYREFLEGVYEKGRKDYPAVFGSN